MRLDLIERRSANKGTTESRKLSEYVEDERRRRDAAVRKHI